MNLPSRLLPVFFLCAGLSFAAPADSGGQGKLLLDIPSLKMLKPLNGVNPAPYDAFWEKWYLVTVRFRGDNGEQRFIYANDVAVKAMKSGATQFPDGSVFGKVAFSTADDEAFPNSKEAGKFVRLQLMVKDSKKFKERDGWSYWLHLPTQSEEALEDMNDIKSCHGCHTLAKNRDFVFARPTFISTMKAWSKTQGTSFQDQFKTRETATLEGFDKALLGLLSKPAKTVQYHQMRMFTGSVRESITPLIQFAQDGKVYVLVDPDTKNFLVVEPTAPADGCRKQAYVYIRKRTGDIRAPKVKNLLLARGTVCDGTNKWDPVVPLPVPLQ